MTSTRSGFNDFVSLWSMRDIRSSVHTSERHGAATSIHPALPFKQISKNYVKRTY